MTYDHIKRFLTKSEMTQAMRDFNVKRDQVRAVLKGRSNNPDLLMRLVGYAERNYERMQRTREWENQIKSL